MSMRRDGDQITAVFTTRQVTATVVGLVAMAGALLGGSALRRARAAGLAVVPDSVWAAGPRLSVATEGRPFLGPLDAPITIVEFTDYQCPFCRRYARETLPRLLDRQGGRIRYVVRNFPIPSLNANALPAAEAVECAHRQGRFWEYHDALFRAGGALTAELLKALADSAGLETRGFGRCLDDRATREVVGRDILDAWELGVAGTPTFFVNGRRVRGVRSVEEMERYIELAREADRR